MSQNLPLREQLKALESLQEIDLKIDVVRKKKQALPVAMKALEDSLQKARATVEARKAAIGEIEKLQRQAQAALDLNRDRLQRSSTRLESVANSAEYQAASKEVEQLKKMGLSLEEQIKKAQDDIKAGQELLTKAQADHDKIHAEHAEQASRLQSETSGLDGEIAKMGAERAQFTSKVESRILSVYDRVRGSKGGVGIAPAAGGRCGGCNMVIPAQQFNDVQRGQNVQACPTCHRILFIPQAQDAQG